MGIIIRLDKVMLNRKVKLLELAEKIGITYTNLSNLKNGKVTAIRFTTLESICKELNCQPGEILEYLDDEIIKYIESFAKNDTEKEGAINRLYAYADAKGEKNLTLEFAKECFNLVQPISMERVASTVSSYFNIPMKELLCNSRKKEVVRAKQIAMYICNLLKRGTFKEMYEYFNVDAATFVFACDKISEESQNDNNLINDIFKIVDQAEKF